MAKRSEAGNGPWQFSALAVAYEKSGLSVRVQRSDCVSFLKNDLVVYLDITLHFFTSRIK
jgi:hypothetical protein